MDGLTPRLRKSWGSANYEEVKKGSLKYKLSKNCRASCFDFLTVREFAFSRTCDLEHPFNLYWRQSDSYFSRACIYEGRWQIKIISRWFKQNWKSNPSSEIKVMPWRRNAIWPKWRICCFCSRAYRWFSKTCKILYALFKINLFKRSLLEEFFERF